MDDVADLLTELEDYIFVDTVDDYGESCLLPPLPTFTFVRRSL